MSAIFSNIKEKINSGYFINKVFINDYQDILTLIFKKNIVEDNDDDYFTIYLPVPIKSDEEWNNKYKKLNVETIEKNI